PPPRSPAPIPHGGLFSTLPGRWGSLDSVTAESQACLRWVGYPSRRRFRSMRAGMLRFWCISWTRRRNTSPVFFGNLHEPPLTRCPLRWPRMGQPVHRRGYSPAVGTPESPRRQRRAALQADANAQVADVHHAGLVGRRPRGAVVDAPIEVGDVAAR